MASSPEAARLTELHRQGQTRIGQTTADLMSRGWRLVDPNDLDGSFSRWNRFAETVIRSQGAQSAQLSAGYYSAFRSVEMGSPLDVPAMVDVSSDVVAANMRYTGPGAVKRAMRVSPIDRAMEIGQAMSARSASRLAMNCGRDTMTNAIVADDDCIGYARATGGRACSFCAMLASRGAVYKSRDSANFRAHDGCNCTAEPVYAGTLALPPGSEYYRDLWDESTAGLGGADARAAFRKALDENPLPVPKPQRAPRKPRFTDDDYDAVAERFGVSADEVRTSRRSVAEIRRRVYDEAAASADEAFELLDRADAITIRAPRAGSGNFDWMEQLDARERARLGRRWLSNDPNAQTVEEVAQRLREAMGGLGRLSDDEVIRQVWLPRTRTIDASGAVRRGRLPSSRQYSGGIDAHDLAPSVEAEGYDVVRLFDNDLEAAGHIAKVHRAQWSEDAYRVLDSASTRGRLGPSPWEMSFQAWEDEVRMLEAGLDGLDDLPISISDARDRLDELIPSLLDEPGMSYEDVYAAVVTTARTADLDVPARAVIDWMGDAT